VSRAPARARRLQTREGRIQRVVEMLPAIARSVGSLMVIVAASMLVSGGVGLLMSSSKGAIHMAVSALILLVFAAANLFVGRNARFKDLDRRQAFVVVSVSWLALCVAGGLPFVVGADFTFAEALFESTSGFTTTGATILPEIRERLNPALHFWRCLSHWLGGMGIVVLFVAVFPALGMGGKHLFRSEVAGPKSKGLSPRVRETSSVLWKVYVILTLLQMGMLLPAMRSVLAESMSWKQVIFEVFCHALSTMGTGGFSTFNGSVGEMDSWVVDFIILVFMVIAGMNFGLFYEASKRGLSVFWKDAQTQTYVCILGVISLGIAIAILPDVGGNPLRALRLASFQSASIMSTTGFGTADFEQWPSVTRMLLLVLYFVGGCSGSTAGGMKLSRVIVLFKAVLVELRKSFRPHLVLPVRVNRQPVDNSALVAVLAFMGLYVASIGFGAIWVAMVDRTDGTTAVMASLACVSNVGPGFGMVGPTDNFGFLSGPTQVVLSCLMLLGRLEFLTLLAMFTPGFWRR